MRGQRFQQNKIHQSGQSESTNTNLHVGFDGLKDLLAIDKVQRGANQRVAALAHQADQARVGVERLAVLPNQQRGVEQRTEKRNNLLELGGVVQPANSNSKTGGKVGAEKYPNIRLR